MKLRDTGVYASLWLVAVAFAVFHETFLRWILAF